MTSLFCRHNRMTAQAARSARRSWRPSCARRRRRGRRASAARRPRRARPPRAPRRAPAALVTRRLARAADDGYRNRLVPGLRATADAERLAAALLIAAERLEPPGPYEAVATEPDLEQATWLAFLLALAGPDDPERQDAVAAAAPRFEDGELPEPLAGARAHDRRLPPVGGARRLAGRGLHRRARLVAAAPLRARVRAARPARPQPRGRASSCSRRSAPPGSTSSTPTRSSSAPRTTPRRRPPSGRCSRATGCCSSAARATSPPRASVPLAALDRGLALWDDPARGDRRGRGAPAPPCAPPCAAVTARAVAPARCAPRRLLRARRGLRPGCAARLPRARRARALLPAGPTYDPWAWIIWGREITEGDLDTRTGPSWKPLPVLFTTPFALTGDAGAPELWL